MLATLQGLAARLVLGGATLGCFCLIAATFSVFRFTSRSVVQDSRKPPVTILKPLCGDEHGLAMNLRSFCTQDYGVYQIIFGVQSADDAALSVARALVNEFPAIDITIVVDRTRLYHNMKVANLQNMLAAAKYDYLVIADSDMRVRPDYLTQVTASLSDPSVGAVTCLYHGLSNGSFWSDMSCLHINCNFLPQAILGEALTIGNGCFGATIAIRREMLDQIGGFGAIGNVLADDHEVGRLVRQQGKRVILSPHIIDDLISEPNLRSLFKHETRWARTIHAVHRGGYGSSLLTHPVALAVIGILCSPWPDSAAFLLIGAVLTRLSTVLLTSWRLGSPMHYIWLLPLRDMLSFVVFLNGFLYGTVQWRSNKFRVARNGTITLMET
jgi:ceramide glucosyltransferase